MDICYMNYLQIERMSDEACGSGDLRHKLRSHSANSIQQGMEVFQTSYDNIDIMQWEDDIIGND